MDSVPDLLSCASRMLDGRALPPMQADGLRPMVGNGLRALAERILCSRRAVPDDAAVSAYRAGHAVHAPDRSRLFPGIATMPEDALADGVRLPVRTSKPAADARRLPGTPGVGSLPAVIGGGDSFAWREPDPPPTCSARSRWRTGSGSAR